MALVFRNDKEVMWKAEISDKERLAGMYAIASAFDIEEGHFTYDGTDLSEYILVEKFLSANFNPSIMTKGGLKYKIWLRTNSSTYLTLFTFNNETFLKGIYDVCDFYEIDIRDYMMALPYDDDGITYLPSDNLLQEEIIAYDSMDEEDSDPDENDPSIQPIDEDSYWRTFDPLPSGE